MITGNKRRSQKISKMIFRMGKLVLQPGDLVVLQTDLVLDKEQVQQIKVRANEQFKPFKTIIISGMKIGVLRKARVKRHGKDRTRGVAR
jgi:hypothetical protein